MSSLRWCAVFAAAALAATLAAAAPPPAELSTRDRATGFCGGGEDGFEVVWQDEFDSGALDEKSWNVAVSPPGTTRQSQPAQPRSSDARSDSSPTRSHDSVATSKGERRRLHRAPRADCHGQGCILLGSCRDAACTADNVAVADGKLVLRSDVSRNAHRDETGSTRAQHQRSDADRARASGVTGAGGGGSAAGTLTTGAVNTWGKRSWRAGEGTFRVCVSAMLPGVADDANASQGLWPAHWLMPQDDTCDPDEGEMDIMEMVDGSGLYEATYHWQTTFPKTNCSYPHGHYEQHAAAALGPRWNATLHEFAVERSTTHVAFVLDGVTRVNITRGTEPSPVFWDVDWYLILNTAVGGGWPGPANASTRFPALHHIDYVRVSQQRRGGGGGG